MGSENTETLPMTRSTFTIGIALFCSTVAFGAPRATGNKRGIVVVEVPAKPQWCEIRNTVFSWTPTRFPFHTSSAKKLNVTDPPIITVIGKAYFDVGHAPKDQSNRRKYLPDYAEWEIHPVTPV
jgi:hypothetical protein